MKALRQDMDEEGVDFDIYRSRHVRTPPVRDDRDDLALIKRAIRTLARIAPLHCSWLLGVLCVIGEALILDLLHLAKLEFNRRRSPKDRDGNLQP